MKIEATYTDQTKDYPFLENADTGAVVWIATSSKKEVLFPNCPLMLVIKTNRGAVSLSSGYHLTESDIETSHYIDADVKIVDDIC